jgi:hypothetical protein
VWAACCGLELHGLQERLLQELLATRLEHARGGLGSYKDQDVE